MKHLMILSILLLLLSPHFSVAFLRLPNPNFNSPTRQAEKLIRQLNLFPKEPVNLVNSDGFGSFTGPKLVERRFKFPNLTGSAASASIEDLGHHAGYYQIQHSHAAKMFYFFFESRNSKEDPVVIWLTGGPGCSSELALFYENGPFTIADNLSLVWNEYGWDKASNLLYVDQPIGTGFSYSTDIRDIVYDEAGVSNDLYDFLQAFFSEHLEFAKNDFYITGESYAGHYIPAFAARVHQGNKANEGIHINLKGFAIGNGLTDPAIQYAAYTDYALEMGIISQSVHDRINKVLPLCEAAIKLCGTDGTLSCVAANLVCNTIFSSIISHTDDINDRGGALVVGSMSKLGLLPADVLREQVTLIRDHVVCTTRIYYDIRKKCIGSLCYDFSNMDKFLNQESVRAALGVGDIKFVSCSTTVYVALLMDWMRNLEVGIPSLLEDGIKLLVYAGEYDLICNWLGNSRWVHAMEWSGQKEFVASTEVPFEVDGSEAGLLKSYGPLSFLKVHDAGHMVPMDQPKPALEMLKRWMDASLSKYTGQQENLVSFM